MSLTLGSSVFLFIVALIAAGAFSYWSYRRTTPAVSPTLRTILAGLRFAALALIILLLFDPSVRRTHVEIHEPDLLFLIDNSASIPFVEGDNAREHLLQTFERTPSATRSMPAHAFAGTSRSIGTLRDARDSLSLQGTRTNMAAAIDAIRTSAGRATRGVVLISDGLYNSGRNPAFAADDSPIPIHTVVAGDTSAFVDVIMREVSTNEIASSDTELPVRARIVSEGFAGRQATVTVFDGTARVASESIQLRGDGTEQTVDLYVIPSTPGLKRYVVHVTEMEGEASHRNNARAITVRVVDSRRRVLIIGGGPDPDLGALRQSLARDGEVEIETRIQRTPQTFYEGTLPSDFSSFDLVVLAGFPSPGTPTSVIATVVEGVSTARSPVLFLAGRTLNVEGIRVLGDAVSPALPTGGSMTRMEALPVLTTTGTSHPVTATVVESAATWSRLPPLLQFEASWRASADASVLLESGGRTTGGPLLVVRSRGGARHAALLAADSWRWRTVSPSISGAEALYDRLLDNIVQWLVSPEDARLVRVDPSQDHFEGTESVRFTGEVYDERLAPVEDAEVEVEIRPDDGSASQIPMRAEGRGRYRLDAGSLPEGTYQYTATARRAGEALGSDSGVFSVGALELEYLHTRADVATMHQIAARSGGRAVTLAELPSLVDELLRSPSFTPEREHIVRESSLRHVLIVLIVIVLLLAAEWVLRRRSGMV
jgi:hypothetical protein